MGVKSGVGRESLGAPQRPLSPDIVPSLGSSPTIDIDWWYMGPDDDDDEQRHLFKEHWKLHYSIFEIIET